MERSNSEHKNVSISNEKNNKNNELVISQTTKMLIINKLFSSWVAFFLVGIAFILLIAPAIYTNAGLTTVTDVTGLQRASGDAFSMFMFGATNFTGTLMIWIAIITAVPVFIVSASEITEKLARKKIKS